MNEELYCSSELNAWWYLPSLIEFLQKSRLENPDQEYSMNISIILHSATILEGFLNELLSEYIGESINDKTWKHRLNHELNSRIEKSSWGDLQYLYKLIFGKDLSSNTDNDTWKGINSLFDFRNMLTHGKIIRLNVYKENGARKAKLTGKYEKVYNFLSNEKKLIEKVNLEMEYPSIDLVTNKAADYYWRTTFQFLTQVYKTRRKDVPLIEDSFEMTFGKEN